MLMEKTGKSRANFVIILCAIVAVICIVRGICSFRQTQMEYIPSRQYFNTALNLIKNAEKSIYASLYIIKSNGDTESEKSPDRLLQGLIERHKNGIDVIVGLDQSYNYGSRRRVDAISDDAFLLLSTSGVAVWRDSPEQLMHAKVLVVDERHVLIGSTNWTYSALNFNVESNVLIHSKNLAKEIISHFDSLREGNL